MNTKTIGDSQPKTDEEYKQEIDRMIPEIEALLTKARRTSEQSRRIGASNRRRLDALEEQLKCGNLYSEQKQIDAAIRRESELREGAMRELRLEQQSRILEELRRLGPKANE